jgi:hypothetical protein
VRDPGYGACSDSWVAATSNSVSSGGLTYNYASIPGNYFIFNDFSSCPSGCGPDPCVLPTGNYYITTCATTGAYRVSFVSCSCTVIC